MRPNLISDSRISLMWQASSHFSRRYSVQRYFLIKCDAERSDHHCYPSHHFPFDASHGRNSSTKSMDLLRLYSSPMSNGVSVLVKGNQRFNWWSIYWFTICGLFPSCPYFSKCRWCIRCHSTISKSKFQLHIWNNHSINSHH